MENKDMKAFDVSEDENVSKEEDVKLESHDSDLDSAMERAASKKRKRINSDCSNKSFNGKRGLGKAKVKEQEEEIEESIGKEEYEEDGQLMEKNSQLDEYENEEDEEMDKDEELKIDEETMSLLDELRGPPDRVENKISNKRLINLISVMTAWWNAQPPPNISYLSHAASRWGCCADGSTISAKRKALTLTSVDLRYVYNKEMIKRIRLDSIL